jgi:hypothetical protein
LEKLDIHHSFPVAENETLSIPRSLGIIPADRNPSGRRRQEREKERSGALRLDEASDREEFFI